MVLVLPAATANRRTGQGWLMLACLLFAPSSCASAYIDTLAPKDAAFDVACGERCGVGGRDKSLAVEVIFGKKYQRTFAICCADRDLVLAQLVTVRDMWCGGFSPSPEGVSRGLAVPPKLIGELTIGTTTSAISGKRALTLEQGEGYVAFQCDAWLPTLIDRLEASRCCVK